jgi:hypothetical protein
MCAALSCAPRFTSHELNLCPVPSAKKPIHAAGDPLFADHVTAPYANRVAEMPRGSKRVGLVLAAGASTNTPCFLLDRLGLQGFRWAATVDPLVFGGESTVVQEAPLVRYGCGGGDIGVCCH